MIHGHLGGGRFLPPAVISGYAPPLDDLVIAPKQCIQRLIEPELVLQRGVLLPRELVLDLLDLLEDDLFS